MLAAGANIVVRWRMLIVGKRIYQMAMSLSRYAAFNTGQPSSDPKELTDFYQMISSRYFDSFKLTDGPQETIGEVDKMILSLKGKENIYGVCLAGEPRCKPVPGTLTRVETGHDIRFPQATNLPRPAYPPVAKAAHIKGLVEVKVVIDGEGKSNRGASHQRSSPATGGSRKRRASGAVHSDTAWRKTRESNGHHRLSLYALR